MLNKIYYLLIKEKYKYKILNYKHENMYIYIAYISMFIVLFFIDKKKINIYNKSTNYDLYWYIKTNLLKILIWKNVFIEDVVEINDKLIKDSIFKIITILENSNLDIITVEKINTKNKTIKFFDIKLKKKNINYIDTKINDKEYNYFTYNDKYYLYKNHFLTILEINKINDKSNEYIKLKDDLLINKIIKNHIIIDWSLFLELLNITIINLKYKNINEVIDKLNNMTENKLYKSNKKEYENLSTIVNHYNFYLENKDYSKIYFSFSFDFRGRLYADHSCSYTNSKITRNCILVDKINFNNYKINLNSKTENILNKYTYLIEDRINKINSNVKVIIIWILISLGKLFKDKNKKKISITDFILIALKNINNDESINKLKIDDLYEFIKYKKIYYNLLENNTNYLYTISKDATASGIQHLIRILGEKNDESFIYANMNSELYWYDTYNYIIDNFFKKNNIPEIYKEVLNRKTLKKTIMIENYGARYNKCLKEFLESIDDKKKNSLSLLNIKSYYKLFFNELRSVGDDNIFFNNIDVYDKDKLEIYLNDSKINLTYYKILKKQLSLTIKKKRNTIQFKHLGDIDYKKTKTSYKANLTHSFDAEIVRRMILLNDKQIFTIHDCFIIPITDISQFIDNLNEQMKKSSIINEKNIVFDIYSLFIII